MKPVNSELFYTQKPSQVAHMLGTNLESGLSIDEASSRLLKSGKNILPEPKRASLLELFIKQFASFLIYILLGACALSLFLGDYKDSILIGIVVLLNACIGFYQEYKAEKTLASLKRMASPSAKVLRNSQVDEIATAKLVPGDIVILEEGDVVPADIRLFESVGLEINEAALTGESTPSQKEWEVEIDNKVAIGDQLNMAFMGTTVVSGNGIGIVISTGDKTEIGKIAQTLAIPYEKPTPLQKNLAVLGKYIVAAAIIVSFLIFLIGLMQGREGKELLFTVISLAVAVIPEGLIAVVTVTMAIGVQRMAKRNAIVRSLPSVETLGSVSVIASDKTGTLTEGKMVATNLWIGGRDYTLSGSGVTPVGSLFFENKKVATIKNDVQNAAKIMALCNDAIVQKSQEDVWEGIGDPTEVALQSAAIKLAVSKTQLEKTNTFVEGLPFDAERKRMSVLYKEPGGFVEVLTKGAPEEIISICVDKFVEEKVQRLTPKDRTEIKEKAQQMAEEGLRVLALCTTTIKKLGEEIEPSNIEDKMTFVGLVGVLDPARPEAAQAVAECKRAGIAVIMVTGDHPATAKTIASQLNIFDKANDRIMLGEEMDNLTEESLMLIKPFPKIFARVSPENKLMLINTLRKMHFIVAMTGDGVNDAPAIKHSNVGIAMGKEGTDVARQAADIVLADDNFATIVGAVEEGRRIFANIRKFIRYLLSCNFSNVFAILISTIAGFPLPFTPIQILWLNLVTDSPPALALGFDKLETSAMSLPPRNSKKNIFRKADVFFILYHGFIMASIMLTVFLAEVYFAQSPIDKARTMAFAMLVLVQLTQAFNSKSTGSTLFRKDIFSNKGLVIGVLLSFSLLLAGMYLPILNQIFEQVTLTPVDWLKLTSGVVVYILFAEVFKLVRRVYFPHYSTRQS